MTLFHSTLYTHSLTDLHIEQKKYVWTLSGLAPFDELLLSWNALRPLKGHYVILSRLLVDNAWSPWLLFAVWGSEYQYSFHDSALKGAIRSFQDQVELLDNNFATGFSPMLKNFFLLFY